MAFFPHSHLLSSSPLPVSRLLPYAPHAQVFLACMFVVTRDKCACNTSWRWSSAASAHQLQLSCCLYFWAFCRYPACDFPCLGIPSYYLSYRLPFFYSTLFCFLQSIIHLSSWRSELWLGPIGNKIDGIIRADFLICAFVYFYFFIPHILLTSLWVMASVFCFYVSTLALHCAQEETYKG